MTRKNTRESNPDQPVKRSRPSKLSPARSVERASRDEPGKEPPERVRAPVAAQRGEGDEEGEEKKRREEEEEGRRREKEKRRRREERRRRGRVRRNPLG